MSASSTGLLAAEGPGSVSQAPNLADGFTDTFTSRYVDTGDLRPSYLGPPESLRAGSTHRRVGRPAMLRGG